MYRELIAELIRDTEWASLQPPCPEKTLAEAERAVGFSFPEELKNVLRETNGDRWFLLSAEQIIENAELNREAFTGCLEPDEYDEKVNRFIFFATNGCGDYYCYRVLPDGKADESQILLWCHEDFEVTPVAADMIDVLNKYYHSEI